MWNIDFYETADGDRPIDEFIASIKDKKLRAKLYRSLNLLETYGNELREPDSKQVQKGIYELRTKQGNNIIRSLYFFFVGNTIVITNGFIKKTQRTPKSELLLARKRMKDYIRRNHHE